MTVIFIVYLEHILKNEIISKPLLMKNGHNTIVNLCLAWRLGDSDGLMERLTYKCTFISTYSQSEQTMNIIYL